MKSSPPCHSRKKPRPLSSGFHHQPDSGWLLMGFIVLPAGTMLKRSIATVPPGQIIVPCVASLKASVRDPALTAGVGLRYVPPNDWPRAYASRLPVKSEPSREVLPEATYHVERPDRS